jgi:hypothetical protein
MDLISVEIGLIRIHEGFKINEADNMPGAVHHNVVLCINLLQQQF